MAFTYVNRIVPGFPQNPRTGLTAIFIHETAGSASALQEGARVQSPAAYNNGIAHWYVDGTHAVQTIDERFIGWHAGVWPVNQTTLSIETCQSMGTSESVYRASLANAILLAVEICRRHGLNPMTNVSIIRNHNEVAPTACPHRSRELFGGSAGALATHRRMVQQSFSGGSVSGGNDVMRQNFNNVHTRVRLNIDRDVFFLPNERKLYRVKAGQEMIVHYEAVMINGFAWNKCSIIGDNGRIDSRWINLQRENGTGKTYTTVTDPFQWNIGTADCSTQNAEIARLNRNISNAITALQVK